MSANISKTTPCNGSSIRSMTVLLPEMPVQQPAEVSRQCSAGRRSQPGQTLMVRRGEHHADALFRRFAGFHKNHLDHSYICSISESIHIVKKKH